MQTHKKRLLVDCDVNKQQTQLRTRLCHVWTTSAGEEHHMFDLFMPLVCGYGSPGLLRACNRALQKLRLQHFAQGHFNKFFSDSKCDLKISGPVPQIPGEP